MVGEEDRVSIGRIILFGLIVSAFFGVIYSVISYAVELTLTTPQLVETAVGRNEFMPNLRSVASTLASWLGKVFTSEIGLAVVIVVTLIYAVLTED